MLTHHNILDRLDNLISVFMAIGSPALAGYSLAITRLNGRWLARQFSDLDLPEKSHIPFVISTLQHVPLRIDTSGPFLPSLVALPQNDRYWKTLGTAAHRTRQWSIPVAMNIIWVLIAFLLTIVDSFVDFDNFIAVPGDAGYSISAAWTYLLPLVVGWLYVGSQPEANHLRNALADAHRIAYVDTAAGPILAAQAIGYESTRAIEVSARHLDHVTADEKKATPVFNYSRVFIWSQHAEYILRLYERMGDQRITMKHREERSNDGGSVLDRGRVGSELDVVECRMDEPGVPVGPIRKDSSPRFPPPFSPYSPFPASPEPSTTSLAAGMYADTYASRRVPSGSSKYDEEASTSSAEARPAPEKPVFATEVFQRVALATFLALGLQWCTTGASILIHINTPPKGVGCRATTFLIFGVAATLAFFLFLLSSVLAHMVRRRSAREEQSVSKGFIGYVASFARWAGKIVAVANGFGILITCVMQFAGTYDSCYCSSTIFGGNPNGMVWFVDADVKGSEVYRYWIGGTIMAFGASGLYAFAIYIATAVV